MSQTSMKRVADVVADYFVSELGIDTCFCVTGAGIMHLTDGLANKPELRTVFPHHEQSVSMAVDAYSRVSGKLGVAMLSTGPAATNAITGLAGCWQDSVATLFISGQVKTSESTHHRGLKGVRQFGVQELNILPIVESVTKFSAQVSRPEDILLTLDKAVWAARSGRPGPAWVEIPMDVQAALVDVDRLQRGPHFTEAIPEETVEDNAAADLAVQSITSALRQSRRPVIIAGQGIRISGQTKQFKDFVDNVSIPVVTPYLGYDCLPRTHRSHLGVVGVKGDRVANWAMQFADLIVVLGSSMHVSVTGYDYSLFSPQSRKIVVDIDGSAFNKQNVSFDEFFELDLSKVLPKLKSIENFNFQSWIDKLQKLATDFPLIDSEKQALAEMSIYKFISMINNEVRGDDVVISDAGSAFYAVSQALITNSDSQRYITSGAMATMGFSLPAAIGACFAQPSRVIAFTGDGSLQQNLQELSLLAHHKLNLKLIVLNNDGYLSIRASQFNYFKGRLFGTDEESGLPMPSLKLLASAFGLRYVRVETEADFFSIKDLFSDSMPLLVDVACPPNEPITPTLSSVLDETGRMISPGLEDMSPRLSNEQRDAVERWILGSQTDQHSFAQ